MKTVSGGKKKKNTTKNQTKTHQDTPTFCSTPKWREAIAVIQLKVLKKKKCLFHTFLHAVGAIHRTHGWHTFLVPSGLRCGSSASVHVHPHIVGRHHPRLISFQWIRPESKSRYFGSTSYSQIS